MPGDSAAAAGRPIFAIDGALRGVLREVFTSHPEKEPADYKDNDADDGLVFQEVAPEPTDPSGGTRSWWGMCPSRVSSQRRRRARATPNRNLARRGGPRAGLEALLPPIDVS